VHQEFKSGKTLVTFINLPAAGRIASRVSVMVKTFRAMATLVLSCLEGLEKNFPGL